MQAIYHQASLGVKVDLVIKQLTLMKDQPATLLNHHDGERGGLLDDFCRYNKEMNPPKETGKRWDMGIYLSA